VEVVQRRSVLEVDPDPGFESPVTFSGLLDDVTIIGERHEPMLALSIRGRTAQGTLLEELELKGDDPGLVSSLIGTSAVKGLRRRLAGLLDAGDGGRALRRLLWDLPMGLRVSSQAMLLDHPAITPPPPMGVHEAGVDQCAGWQRGGEMLRLIESSGGALPMQLSDEVVGDDHLGHLGPPALPALATRRRRLLRVDRADGVLRVHARHRDSYADPDGVERALHHWVVDVIAGAEDQVITAVSVRSLALPWRECPSAAGSGQRLVGRSFTELEELVPAEFTGTSTCTHLNDTYVSLAGVPELLVELEAR
jgi:hypothetical protein